MATSQVHPLLRKDEETVEEPQSDAVVETPETESIEPQEEAEDESKYLVTFDRRKAPQAFAEWQKDGEAKDLANALNSFVGQKARREYKPKLDEMALKLAEAEAKYQQVTTRNMTPEQVKERLYSDPDFRQNFGQVADPQALAQKQSLERALENVHEAVASALTEDEMSGFKKSLEGGWYDYERDETGKPLRALPVEEALSRYNRDLFAAAQAKGQGAVAPPPTRPAGPPPPPTITPPVAKPKAAPNPRIAQASPDMSAASVGSTGAARMSVSEYKAMNWTQRAALFPDYEKARKAGLIYDG